LGGPLLLVRGRIGDRAAHGDAASPQAVGSHVPTRLLSSARTCQDIIFHGELDRMAAADLTVDVCYTLTRTAPPGWTGYHRRIDAAMPWEVAWRAEERPLAYICGPTPFANVAGFLHGVHGPQRPQDSNRCVGISKRNGTAWRLSCLCS
jgi:NAD(P)H-flavin reductase